MNFYLLKRINPETHPTVSDMIKSEMGRRSFPLAVRDGWNDLDPKLVRVPGGTVPGGDLFSLQHFEFEKIDSSTYINLKA